MMTTAAVIGLSAGKRILSSSFCYSDLTDKFIYVNDLGMTPHQTKNVISAKKSSNFIPSFPSSNKPAIAQSIKAVKEDVDSATTETWFQISDYLDDDIVDTENSIDALLLLQKSMLEKQYNLSFDQTAVSKAPRGKTRKNIPITCSGVSARHRRISLRRKNLTENNFVLRSGSKKQQSSFIGSDVIQNRVKGGYVKGAVSDELLTHAEVVHLSKKIKTGLSLDELKSRMKEKLGCEPSDEQLATSLRISRTELQSILIECSLAREKLTMSNIRLVMSIAQRYDNMGAEMADLIQGGLIGLLRGIEKFDSSKGFKISTYVYWWIRQGVSRALAENSRTLRLPAHLHERLGLIRNVKIRLEEKGIVPSIDKIAQCLNMSQKKVRNATEAISKVFSLDRPAFPALNGLPGETLHSYIADNRLENQPWHNFDEWALQDEVNKLINATLVERERDIIRLYYGLDNECLTWEDISKRIGLSRERVRQVGLVALEKLKNAARKRKMEAMLLKQ